MRTDSLFYKLFQKHPNLVFELLGNVPPIANSYIFVSQEVKQLAFRIDGILNPSADAPDLPIVFVEVQGYRDQLKTLYHSFFAEIILYLRDYQPVNDWLGILIFTKQSLDPGLPTHFQDYANSRRFQRIYLDELPVEGTGRSLELGILQLIGIQENEAPNWAKQLIERTRSEVTDVAEQQQIIELVLTILVYKFPSQSREEIRQMFGLDELKQTKFYQEVKEETRDEIFALAIPALLKAGLSVEQIAEQLETDTETIERLIQQQQQQN